jgi:hypothetical protein
MVCGLFGLNECLKVISKLIGETEAMKKFPEDPKP